MSIAAADGFDLEAYPIEVRERSGLFYLICKTFNIVESDASIDQAYNKLVVKRKQILQELSSFGIDFSNSNSINLNSGRTSTLQKWMQISIIFMCLGLPIGLLAGTALLASKASGIITAAKSNIQNKVLAVFNNPAQLTLMLNKITEKLENVTPERREELQLEMRKIVTFMKPLVSELQQLS